MFSADSRRRLMALALGFGLVASACGGGGSDATSAEPADPEVATGNDASGGAATAAWPALVAPVAGGGQFDLGDLEGQDVILWFWAPW